MASGNTTTASVADSLPEWIMSARQVAEFTGIMTQLVDKQRLGVGLGLTWQEVSFAKISAQAVSETTDLDNYQQLSDTNLGITPTLVGIAVLITDRVRDRIAKASLVKMGGLAQNALERKKDEDGLASLDGATTSLSGAGTTLTTGVVSAASSRIRGNTTEPGPDPLRCVLHPYQIKDLADELVSGVGTYAIPEGPTAKVFQQGYKIPIDNTEVYPDGNITIDSSADAKGGVFSSMGLILVQGKGPRAVSVRKENIGGGSEVVYHYDEYAWGERSPGNWLYEVYSDATAPTS